MRHDRRRDAAGEHRSTLPLYSGGLRADADTYRYSCRDRYSNTDSDAGGDPNRYTDSYGNGDTDIYAHSHTDRNADVLWLYDHYFDRERDRAGHDKHRQQLR
jgi:hypothetical protein